MRTPVSRAPRAGARPSVPERRGCSAERPDAAAERAVGPVREAELGAHLGDDLRGEEVVPQTGDEAALRVDLHAADGADRIHAVAVLVPGEEERLAVGVPELEPGGGREGALGEARVDAATAAAVLRRGHAGTPET